MSAALAGCPDCEGKGTIMALVSFRGGARSGPHQLTCGRCRGSGQVGAQQAHWSLLGARHRHWRWAQREGIEACARRLGVTRRVLTDMEHGRVDPAALRADLGEG